MRVEASAPSNIALIKYMGKDSHAGNLPANPSLSYTLEHLRSFVVIEPAVGAADEWQPLPGFEAVDLSEKGRARFLAHFAKLKAHWGVKGVHRVLSANNFPSDCGLASSASSFAALTLASYQLAHAQNPALTESTESLSRWSRQGSGSSCRSLFSPWSEWSDEGAEKADLGLELEHAVLIVDSGRKSVSSSEAHKRVNTSLLWNGRTERARTRLERLKQSLRLGEWRVSFEVCWAEFWDMHALFETSEPAFGYMTADTLKALGRMRELWTEKNDGPLITMDAGANIHLLFRKDQLRGASAWLDGFKCLRSWE